MVLPTKYKNYPFRTGYENGYCNGVRVEIVIDKVTVLEKKVVTLLKNPYETEIRKPDGGISFSKAFINAYYLGQRNRKKDELNNKLMKVTELEIF